MAVQKMSFVTLIGPIEQFDEVVKKAFKDYDFHAEHALSVLKGVKGLAPFLGENPHSKTLKLVEETLEVSRIPPAFEDFSANNLTHTEVEKLCEETTAKIKGAIAKKIKLEKEKVELERIVAQLDPLKDIEIPIDALINFKYVKFRFGKMPIDSYQKYKLYLEENKNIIYVPAFEADNHIWGIYFTPQTHKENADSLFASLHFERQLISEKAQGTPRQAIITLNQQILALSQECNEVNAYIASVVEDVRAVLLSSYSMVKYESDIFDIRTYSAHSKRNFYITGWLPEDSAAGFAAKFEDDPLTTCISEKAKEVCDVSEPPTKLKNMGIFKPFEEFVTMYGLPSYDEFDPTPLMAITYIVLFGMMFGDVGQGAVLAIFGLVLAKKGMNLGKIIGLVGCSSIGFGFFYGSVFGFEDIIHGFNPLHSSQNINLVIGASIGVGVLLITTAMIINIANGIRQKDAEKVLFSFNGISGLVFYWGVIFAVLGMFGYGFSSISPLYVVLVIIVPLILIYLREPLGKIMEKKADWKPKNMGEYLMEGIFEMFEIILSYITNTVSFMRVGAFALNHAGMMLAVFILARTFGDGTNMFVVVVGNIFVICLEGLIVGIQVLRLEFYELFSRFFSGEGKAFKPFKIKYKKS